jgi:hypothetical protein
LVRNPSKEHDLAGANAIVEFSENQSVQSQRDTHMSQETTDV